MKFFFELELGSYEVHKFRNAEPGRPNRWLLIQNNNTVVAADTFLSFIRKIYRRRLSWRRST